jgi:DNA-binding MltR family transcriptional regulator
LQFELSSDKNEAPVSDEEVWDVLNQLVTHSQLGVDNNVPQLFDQLVSLLARMDDQQLVKVIKCFFLPQGTVVSIVAHNHEIAGSILARSSKKFELK